MTPIQLSMNFLLIDKLSCQYFDDFLRYSYVVINLFN